MHILQALRERKSEQALYETCTYLSSSNTDGLEAEWIAILSEIGMSSRILNSKDLWIQCLHDIKSLLDADAIDVTEALVCTTKLYLLYIKAASPIANSIPQLRARVIEHFPKGVKLSYKGVMVFEKIMPEPSDDQLYDMAHRILSGFIKLLHSHHPLTGNAIEFIARKKLTIPCVQVWPAPSPQEAAKGDPVWFVWGTIMLYFPNDLYISVAWSLFCHKYKKKDKMERIGLLVGCASCACEATHASSMVDTSTSGWTTTEAEIIDNISQLALDLWASHNPASFERKPEPVSPSPVDVFLDFLPTRTKNNTMSYNEDITPGAIKIIHVGTKYS